MKYTRKTLSVLLTLALLLGLLPWSAAPAQAAEAGEIDVSQSAITINSGNKSSYDGKTFTGTVEKLCTDSYFVGKSAAITVDGVAVTIAIRDLRVVASVADGAYGMVSPIQLKDGARLTLELQGTNTLTACFGGAGIAVPEGCTLTITGSGALTARGGNDGPTSYVDGFFGCGGAGIGSTSMLSADQKNGSVIISGGTVTAYGGRGTGASNKSRGAAGIGGSDSADGGSVTISGGTVTAVGGTMAPGIGGGTAASFGNITISGGTVNARSYDAGDRIAIGDGWSAGASGITLPALTITGGTVNANGNIGHPEPGVYTASSSFTLDAANATVNCTGEVTYDNAAVHNFTVGVRDAAVVNNAAVSLTLKNGSTTYKAVDGKLSASKPGVGAFTVRRVVVYGSASELSCTAEVRIGSKTFNIPSFTLRKDTKDCALEYGYYFTLEGSIFDSKIAAGQTGTVSIAGVTETISSDVKISAGTAQVSAAFCLAEGGASDGADLTKTVTVTVGGNSWSQDVVFRKTEFREKSGGFQIATGSLPYIDEDGKEQVKTSGFNGLTGNETTLSDGWYAVRNDVTFNALLTVNGNVKLVLADGAKLTASKGIAVNSGKTLTIYGQGNQTGTLNATGTENSAGVSVGGSLCVYGGTIVAHGGANGAGIGSGYCSGSGGSQNGTIVIGGGSVRAWGGDGEYGGAGIGSGGSYSMGGGYSGNGGTITITGERTSVEAHGGANGAGIGGGRNSFAGTITINGGTVVAVGGENAAGIGRGKNNNGEQTAEDSVTIAGGTVTATGGSCGAGIGGGWGGNMPTVTISGGTVTATGGGTDSHGGAGIGSGELNYLNNITISGSATVVATGAGNAAGIGISGSCPQLNCTIRISAISVTANSENGNSGNGAISAGQKTLVLSWDSLDARIALGARCHGNPLTLEKGFVVEDTLANATADLLKSNNIAGKVLRPRVDVTLAPGSIGGDSQIAGTYYGGSYTLPNCPFNAPTGKEFSGWLLEGDETGTLRAEGTVISNVTAGFTLTAQWVSYYSIGYYDTDAERYLTISARKAYEGDLVMVTHQYAPRCLCYIGVYKGGEKQFEIKSGEYFAMPAANVKVGCGEYFDLNVLGYGTDPLVDGSAEHPWLIGSESNWDSLNGYLQNDKWNDFAGMTVKLSDNFNGTLHMLGTSEHPFKGIFDGNGKTVGFYADSQQEYVAPFRYVDGATIRDLRISASTVIALEDKYMGGLVAHAAGNTRIENCRVSTDFRSRFNGMALCGGLVAKTAEGSITDIVGCVFDGSMTDYGQTTGCGGFVGENSGTVNVVDSVFAPQKLTFSATDSATFARDGEGASSTFTNCYYTTALGEPQGKAPCGVTAGDNYAVVGNIGPVGGAVRIYDVSGVTVYASGLGFGDAFYYGGGDTVSLALSHKERSLRTFRGYKASAGTLSGNDAAGWTLTLPDEGDVTISVQWEYMVDRNFSSDGSGGYNMAASVIAPANSLLILAVYDYSTRQLLEVRTHLFETDMDGFYVFEGCKMENGKFYTFMLVDAETYAPLCASSSMSG